MAGTGLDSTGKLVTPICPGEYHDESQVSRKTRDICNGSGWPATRFIRPGEEPAETSSGQPFSLTFRTYVPEDRVLNGDWFPPAIEKID